MNRQETLTLSAKYQIIKHEAFTNSKSEKPEDKEEESQALAAKLWK